MPAQASFATLETLPPGGRVHVIGAGPVGLMLAALLQPMEARSVRLYEKRREYTRSRMVQLAPYLVADSVESYRADFIDGDNVEAVFDPAELDVFNALRRLIPSDLMALLRAWALGFCPLNDIETSLSDLIDERGSNVQRTEAEITVADARAMLEPGDILVDCTGRRSVLRDHLAPGSPEVEGARTRKACGSNMRSSLRFSTASGTSATSIASTTRTSTTCTTSSFLRCTARSTTAASAT